MARLKPTARAKARMFENQTAEDAAIINADDTVAPQYAPCEPRVFWFSRTSASPAAAFFAAMKSFSGATARNRVLLERQVIGLRGNHNVENVLAAAAAARIAGVEPAAIAEGVRSFAGVEHRLEFVATIAGVDYFNDSKATNVDATLKALDAFSGNVLVILGGKDKGSDLRDSSRAAAQPGALGAADRQRRGKNREATCGRRPRGARRDTGGAPGNCRAARATRRHGSAGSGLREFRPV